MNVSWIFALLNFPGVVAHEASHKFFCDWAGVRVLKVCYFRFGNPAGFVMHEAPRKFSQSFFISVGPLILGSLLAFLLFLLFKQHPQEPLGWVFAWLGLSIASQCFPSTGDAKALLSEIKRHFWHNPLTLLAFPVVLLIWLINKLNFLHFNYLFALGFFWWVLIYF